jgi:hypothetical protein
MQPASNIGIATALTAVPDRILSISQILLLA